MATDLAGTLAGIRQDIARFQAAEAALVPLVENNSSPPAAPAAPPAAPSRSSEPSARRPGRPAGTRNKGGTRSEQAVQIVTEHPGIGIPEIAKRMKIEPNYLYRVMPKLVSEGQVRNENGGWHPVAA